MPKKQLFTKGEEVRALVRLGVHTQDHWTKMLYVGRRGGAYVVRHDSTDQERKVSPNQIRKWKPIADWDAAIAKLDEGFPELLAYVNRAAKELLPEKWQGVKVDEGEKSITMPAAGMTVRAAVVEIVRRDIRCETCEEVAAWNITSIRHIPQTYHSPPDYDEVEEGNSTTTWGAAAMLIQKVYEFNCNRFWEGIGEEQYAKMVQEEEVW